MSAFREDLLVGKTAFIAGGTSGISLGIARRYAELGAKVAVAGRNPEKAQAAAESIGSQAIGLSCDVRDYAGIRGALETAADGFGKLDIVVSGAAGNFLAPACDMSANAFRTVIDIDLNGTFNVFRASFDLLGKPGASLIAVSAGQGMRPSMFQAHACAAKAGINHLIRVLAMEWGPLGIRVNGLCPGPTAGTEGMARLTPTEESARRLAAKIPIRRYGEIWEVAESAVFLVSESASYVTGTVLDCHGGSHLGDSSDRNGDV